MIFLEHLKVPFFFFFSQAYVITALTLVIQHNCVNKERTHGLFFVLVRDVQLSHRKSVDIGVSSLSLDSLCCFVGCDRVSLRQTDRQTMEFTEATRLTSEDQDF